MTDQFPIKLTDNNLNNLPTIRVWLGGSFDPIHQGHLAIVGHIYHTLSALVPANRLEISLLPTAGSPLKDQPTSPAQRLQMLRLAVADLPYINIDSTELFLTPPVYSYDTLTTFQQRYPHDCRIFVMGSDSLQQLARWHRGDDLVDLASLWVLPRPQLITDYQPSTSLTKQLRDTLSAKLKNYVCESITDLINSMGNHIYIDNYAPPDIASRLIRQGFSQHASAHTRRDAQVNLPTAVYQFIMQSGLYRC